MHETIAGSPETIGRQVQEVADLGINHLLLRFIGDGPMTPVTSARILQGCSRRKSCRVSNPAFRCAIPARH